MFCRQLPPYYLGQLTLGSASPGPPSSDLTRHQVVDGRQRILMLCLLLGAARRCLLRETAGMQSASSGQRRTAAEQISQLLVRPGLLIRRGGDSRQLRQLRSCAVNASTSNCTP